MSEAKTISSVGTLTDSSDIGGLCVLDSGGNLKKVSLSTLLSAIKVGGRNLLLDSNPSETSAEYSIAQFTLTDTLKTDDEMVLTLWGELGADRTRFSVFNSGGMINLGSPVKIKDGVFQLRFKWKEYGDNDIIWVFQIPKTATSASTINRIKLERGNVGSDWTPAPEDLEALLGGVKRRRSIGYVSVKGGVPYERGESADQLRADRNYDRRDDEPWKYDGLGRPQHDYRSRRVVFGFDHSIKRSYGRCKGFSARCKGGLHNLSILLRAEQDMRCVPNELVQHRLEQLEDVAVSDVILGKEVVAA